jgi:hypothetical protein
MGSFSTNDILKPVMFCCYLGDDGPELTSSQSLIFDRPGQTSGVSSIFRQNIYFAKSEKRRTGRPFVGTLPVSPYYKTGEIALNHVT